MSNRIREKSWRSLFLLSSALVLAFMASVFFCLFQGSRLSYISTLRGHSASVNSVQFSPCGTMIVTASDDSTVRVWSLSEQKQVALFEGYQSSVVLACLSEDCKTLYAVGEDAILKVWDLNTQQLRFSIRCHDNSVICAVQSPDRKYIAIGDLDYRVKIWNLATLRCDFDLPEADSILLQNSLRFAPSGKALYIAASRLVRWDFLDSRVTYLCPRSSKRYTSIVVTPNDQIAITGDTAKLLTRWDTGSQINQEIPSAHKWAVYSLAVSPDGGLLVSGSTGGNWLHGPQLIIAPLANLDQPHIIPGHSGEIRSLAFSPDGKVLASAGADNLVKLWRVK